MRRPYLMGNWKMNQLKEDIDAFFNSMPKTLDWNKIKCALAPQAIHIDYLQNKCKESEIEVGSQNCAAFEDGAYTGELSVNALKQAGVDFSLIGHSERRTLFNESDELLNQKFELCMKHNHKVVFCVGETLQDRESNKTHEVLERQLREGLKGLKQDHIPYLVVAYEPVWAIGTGLTAKPEQANDAHQFIRSFLSEHFQIDSQKVWILYGGSVKPANIEELLAKEDIDGALIGGASLKGESYFEMVEKAISI
ncbi:MAG: triose-phosphate isomerase [Bacteriovoracaceae bacterium]